MGFDELRGCELTRLRLSGGRRLRGWIYVIKELLTLMKRARCCKILKGERTYMSQSHNEGYHNTPTPAAGFSRHNTTDAACREDFCRENTQIHQTIQQVTLNI